MYAIRSYYGLTTAPSLTSPALSPPLSTSNSYIKTFTANNSEYSYFDIFELERRNIAKIGRLPYSIRILVENLLRKKDGKIVRDEDVRAIANWQASYSAPTEIPYHP